MYTSSPAGFKYHTRSRVEYQLTDEIFCLGLKRL